LVEIFPELGNVGGISPAASGGGDSASGVGERAGVTIVKQVVLLVNGSSIFCSSSLLGSGGPRLVEIECQIAIIMVMVQITPTIARTISAAVGIILFLENNENIG